MQQENDRFVSCTNPIFFISSNCCSQATGQEISTTLKLSYFTSMDGNEDYNEVKEEEGSIQSQPEYLVAWNLCFCHGRNQQVTIFNSLSSQIRLIFVKIKRMRNQFLRGRKKPHLNLCHDAQETNYFMNPAQKDQQIARCKCLLANSKVLGERCSSPKIVRCLHTCIPVSH